MSMSMLERLDLVLANRLPTLLQEPEKWESLIVNRRKPHTYRAFTYIEIDGQKYRVALHRFSICDTSEAFAHPHPWPGAFVVLHGGYNMSQWTTPDIKTKLQPNQAPTSTFEFRKHSKYEMLNPLTWHSVTPRVTSYTVMLNGEPWPQGTVHEAAPTTKGKDLDKMSPEDLLEHLKVFQGLVQDYNVVAAAESLTRVNQLEDAELDDWAV